MSPWQLAIHHATAGPVRQHRLGGEADFKRREEIIDDEHTIPLPEARRLAHRLWEDAHASRIMRAHALAEQPVLQTRQMAPTQVKEAVIATPAKREEVQETTWRLLADRTGLAAPIPSILDNWGRFEHYLMCPICGIRCCSTTNELKADHLPACLAGRAAAENMILLPIGRTSDKGVSAVHQQQVSGASMKMRIRRVETARGEIEKLMQEGEQAERGLGLSPRRRVLTHTGQPASAPPSSSLEDFIIGTFNVRSATLHEYLLLPCPMGAKCINISHRLGPSGLAHTEVEDHALACWRIEFGCTTAASSGLVIPTGRTLPLSDIYAWTRATHEAQEMEATDGLSIQKLTVMDALAACDPGLFRLVGGGGGSRRVVGWTRRTDDAVVLADTPLIRCWCSAFLLHLL